MDFSAISARLDFGISRTASGAIATAMLIRAIRSLESVIRAVIILKVRRAIVAVKVSTEIRD